MELRAPLPLGCTRDECHPRVALVADGKRFVYRTFGPNGQGLRIMDLDTNKVTTLTSDYDNFPLWSPRGDLIAFVRRHQGD